MVDKAALLAKRLGEGEIEVEGVGTFRFRALNRKEQLKAVKRGGIDSQGRPDVTRVEIMERVMLAIALLDPEMTEEEVEQWQENAPAGEVNLVAEAVSTLSGMNVGADRAAYKSNGSGPVDRVRPLPRGKAGNARRRPA